MMNDPQLMSGADAAWLLMECPENQMTITGVLFLNPEPDFDELAEVLRKRLLIYDRFRQRLKFDGGTPFWVEEPGFDLQNHLKRVDGEHDLNAFIQQQMSTPMDFTKPLWEITVLPDAAGGCALVVKLHHCIADGIALIQVLLSLATVKPGGAYFRQGTDFHEHRPAFDGNSKSMDLLKKLGRETGFILRALIKLLTMPADTLGPFKGDLQIEKRAAWSKPAPLETIKLIGREYKVTVNDVLLWITCNALREYLHETDNLNADDFARIAIPVNLRMNASKLDLGNKFGLVFITLPVGESDSLTRLRNIQRQMREIKQSREALVAYGVLGILGWAPKSLRNWLIRFLSSKCSAVVTNVPGPKKALYIAGSKLEKIMFWVPKAGRLGVGISLMSYNNEVMIGVSTDAGRVPNPERITELFNKKIEELKVKGPDK